MPTEPILDLVEKYLRDTGAAPSTFGWAAVGDPRFVFQLRTGREPRRRTREALENFIRANPKGLPADLPKMGERRAQVAA